LRFYLSLQGSLAYPAYDPSLGMSVVVALNGNAEIRSNPFVYVSRWSDSGAWPRGRVPREGDDVTISASRTFVLDVSPPRLGQLTLLGSLLFSDDQV